MLLDNDRKNKNGDVFDILVTGGGGRGLGIFVLGEYMRHLVEISRDDAEDGQVGSKEEILYVCAQVQKVLLRLLLVRRF